MMVEKIYILAKKNLNVFMEKQKKMSEQEKKQTERKRNIHGELDTAYKSIVLLLQELDLLSTNKNDPSAVEALFTLLASRKLAEKVKI